MTWFEAFKKTHNVIFTEEDFKLYFEMIEKDLKYFKKYLKPNAKILDLGCGLGCTSIPLSCHSYEFIGIDNDPKVVEAAKQNAKNFGKNIEIKQMDIFKIEKFGKNSFDACISGGVLEHFNEKQIRELVDKQLFVAPLVIASMPVRTKTTLAHYQVEVIDGKEVCSDRIERNLWTENEWKDIFKDFNIVECKVSKCHPKIGNFDDIFIVIKR